MTKSYSELSKLKTFEERFKYLTEGRLVGEQTFGGSRSINQKFYQSKEWREIRDKVIVRDNGMDLGIDGRPIVDGAIVHHIVPLRPEDFVKRTRFLTDPEYMITMSHQTHNAIHYSNLNAAPKDYVERTPNDTCPWR